MLNLALYDGFEKSSHNRTLKNLYVDNYITIIFSSWET